MYDEDELLPLAALQHLMFCERQCALIHIEEVWRDNPLTLEGSHLHERTHQGEPRREVRGDIVICRGLAVRSFTLGVSGITDVVEFHRSLTRDENGKMKAAILLPGLRGEWVPFPVEYKRGKPKPDACDSVQLCAQAVCLEEMLGIGIESGALFYGAIQKRHDVEFDIELRALTKEAARRLHELVSDGRTPSAHPQPKCKRCSMIEACQPKISGGDRSACRYLSVAIARTLDEEVPET